MVVISIPPEERARLNALMAVVVITLTSPFGWIAGQLSEINRIFPFILSIALYVFGVGMIMLAGRLLSGKSGVLAEAPA